MLVESTAGLDTDGQRVWTGYSPNYLKLELRADPEQELGNQMLTVVAQAVDDKGECLIASLA